MRVKVQVVTITDEGQEITREVACMERHDLTPVTLSLSLAEGKAVLQALEEVVVEWQMHGDLRQQLPCPHRGKLRPRKGVHHTAFRTVFGTLSMQSPRLQHCDCQPQETHSFSPLAERLPERTTPELLCLESQWAALVACGLSVKLLQDVLPSDEPLHAVTIRNHVFTLAQRLEDSLGEEQGCYIEGCPRDWSQLPIPDGALEHRWGVRAGSRETRRVRSHCGEKHPGLPM
jgi:hypothetical protein